MRILGKSEFEDIVNPHDTYMESISDFDDMVSDMDYYSTRLDEETKKNVYATKYGIFDLKAKEYLIHADGENSLTNSSNGFLNIRIIQDEISFCNKLVSSQLTSEPSLEKGKAGKIYTKKVWGSFAPLDRRFYDVRMFVPLPFYSKKVIYTASYFSSCRFRECNLFGKNYYREDKTAAFSLFFNKPTPYVVVDLQEYSSEFRTRVSIFGCNITSGIFLYDFTRKIYGDEYIMDVGETSRENRRIDRIWLFVSFKFQKIYTRFLCRQRISEKDSKSIKSSCKL